MKIFLVIMLVMFAGMQSQAGSLDAMMGYSAADEFDIDSGDIEADSAIYLGVRYKDQIGRGLGWNVAAGLDTVRDLDGSSDELGFMIFEGNFTLHVDQFKALYVFAGLNYPLIIYEDKGLSDVDPVLGIQFGTGFDITKQLGFELAFRTANFEFGNQDANLWGFLFRGYYTFSAL